MKPPIPNYKNYEYCENEWDIYYKGIFLTHKPQNDNFPLRLIIMESCPIGPSPHPNYIFSNLTDTLNAISHRYLDQIYKGFFSKKSKVTKQRALIELAKLNVLILDILPSHGMRLESKISRPNINMNPRDTCDLDKVNNIIKKTNSPVHIVYSMPPSINFRAINCCLLPNTCFGTMTSGAGFPSNNLLRKHISLGF
jgi:hypothetical protein